MHMNLRSSTATTREIMEKQKETELLVRNLTQENQELLAQIDELHLMVCLLDLVGCWCSPFLKLFSAQVSPQFLRVPGNKILEGRKIMLQ